MHQSDSLEFLLTWVYRCNVIVILLTAAFQQVPAPPRNRVWTLSTGQSFSGATHERFGLRTRVWFILKILFCKLIQ